MLFEDKLSNSIIIKEKPIPARKMKLPSIQRRHIHISFCFLTCLYTLITKIILSSSKFDLLMAMTILQIATTITLTFLFKTIYALNHNKQYKVLRFINKVCRLFVFICSFVMYINYFNQVLASYDTTFGKALFNFIITLGINNKPFTYLIQNEAIKLLSFFASMIIFIPVLIYFIVFNMKMIINFLILIIPGVNIAAYLIWLFKGNDTFECYIRTSDEFYTKYTRRITINNYKRNKILLKLAFTMALIIGSIILFSYVSPGEIYNSFISLIKNNTNI